MEQKKITTDPGFLFFGKMIASTSHEFKNVLAIINENVGLLDDMNILAQKGLPMDTERLMRLSDSIKKQVNRANNIIQNMSSFAHSMDEPAKTVDIQDALSLFKSMASGLLASQGISLNTERGPVPMLITTNPFYLKYLLWCCIDFIAKEFGNNQTVHVSAEKLENGIKLYLSTSNFSAISLKDSFPAEREKWLITLLGAELVFDDAKGIMRLTLPDKAD